jgi:LPPG:FO 2-phospho-L-lactate transferase
MGSIVAIGGQVGGAKLADGLYRLRRRNLTVIVNTGDDFEHIGLCFSPDLDTMVYTLAGLESQNAGWEPRGETYRLFEMLKMVGGPDRVRLGDQALAIPILRSEGLAAGRTLSEITRGFCQHLGINANIVPMSDDPVRTQLLTGVGAISFQDYFSQLACEPVISGFQYANAAEARIPEVAVNALRAPDLEAVVIFPCNPYHVVRPILETGGMRELLRKQGAPVIAVSPIVGGGALQGSAAKMMQELGLTPLPRTVAMEYRGLIDGFIIDEVDAEQAEGIGASGIEVLVAPTIMRSLNDRIDLAVQVIKFAKRLAEIKAEAAESGA